MTTKEHMEKIEKAERELILAMKGVRDIMEKKAAEKRAS
jgi:hypothetical protein